jgi:hypothetical protein
MTPAYSSGGDSSRISPVRDASWIGSGVKPAPLKYSKRAVATS